ncbi:MAG: SIS domain-containing protein [Pseudohongiellaceae bacterium]
MLEDRVRHRFLLNAELHHAVANQLSAPLAEASERLTGCLLGGRKILCYGSGTGSSNAQYMATLLVNRHERDRPGLPAMALAAEPCSMNATASDYGFDEVLTRQIRTFGQPGDILVLFTTSRSGLNIEAVMHSVRDRQMEALILDDEDTTRFAGWLGESDLEIAVPVSNAASCHELHLSMIHCLCDLIDLQLFGEEL